MKKLLCLLALSGFFVIYSMNTCLVITSPKPGDTWFKGEQKIISWVNQGNNSSGMKINIFRNAITPANFIQQLISGPNGPVTWNIPKSLPSGTYFIRIKTNDGSCVGDSPGFQIMDKINMIPVHPVDPNPPPVHRAPALKEPSGASFQIKDIHYGVNGQGKLEKVGVVVSYTSKTPFSFSAYGGNLPDGPAYMNCKIWLPVWPMDTKYSWIPSETGPLQSIVIFNQRLAVKYAGQNRMECVPDILNVGTGEFELIFTPAHSGKAEGLHTLKKMKGSPLSNPDFCERDYSPKMALRLFIHTKEGVKQVYKEFYLLNAPRKTIKIPGELSICSGGMVYW